MRHRSHWWQHRSTDSRILVIPRTRTTVYWYIRKEDSKVISSAASASEDSV